MNNTSNDSFDNAINEILSISQQLENLRGGVEQYAKATNNLNKLSESLESLSNTLQQLPNSLSTASTRGENIIESIQNALTPAHILLSDVKQISSYVENLPSKEQLTNSLNDLNSSFVIATKTTQELLSSLSRNVEVLAEKHESHFTDISNKVEVLIKHQKSSAEETKGILLTLEKLARRSLFSIVFGRDSGI